MLHIIKISCFLLLVSIFLLSCSPDKDNAKLRILTYNVWYGFTQVPDRKVDWLNWMEKQHPDIVFLQELNGYTPEQLAADAKAWGHFHSVLLKQDGFPTGITSRYPIENVVKTLHGFHHGLIRANINGLVCYCIHLHPGNWQVRMREVEYILNDVRSFPADTPSCWPVILTHSARTIRSITTRTT